MMAQKSVQAKTKFLSFTKKCSRWSLSPLPHLHCHLGGVGISWSCKLFCSLYVSGAFKWKRSWVLGCQLHFQMHPSDFALLLPFSVFLLAIMEQLFFWSISKAWFLSFVVPWWVLLKQAFCFQELWVGVWKFLFDSSYFTAATITI